MKKRGGGGEMRKRVRRDEGKKVESIWVVVENQIYMLRWCYDTAKMGIWFMDVKKKRKKWEKNSFAVFVYLIHNHGEM